jgi:hypothetical protein
MTEQPELEQTSGGPCITCGDAYRAFGIRKAVEWHDADHPDHPMAIKIDGGFLTLNEATLREIENPSGGTANRDETGGNDRYSNS